MFVFKSAGLNRCNTFIHLVRSGQPIVVRESVVNSRRRLQGVKDANALAEHDEHTRVTRVTREKA
eukprot:613363-Pelagomonas_calceolata.AAC.3